MNIFIEIINVNTAKIIPIDEGAEIVLACCLVLVIVKGLNIIWRKKRINQMNNPNGYR